MSTETIAPPPGPLPLRAGPFEADYGNPFIDVISLLLLFAGILLIKKLLK